MHVANISVTDVKPVIDVTVDDTGVTFGDAPPVLINSLAYSNNDQAIATADLFQDMVPALDPVNAQGIFEVVAGALPGFLQLNQNTGIISFTAGGANGSYNWTIGLVGVGGFSGQEIFQCSLVVGPVVSAVVGSLDNVTQPEFCFSEYKLITAYAGDCIRIRRGSDNAEADIGFDANGKLDADAVNAFIGAGTGHLRTFYNQGTGIGDYEMTNVNRQPEWNQAESIFEWTGDNKALVIEGLGAGAITELTAVYVLQHFDISGLNNWDFHFTIGDTNGGSGNYIFTGRRALQNNGLNSLKWYGGTATTTAQSEVLDNVRWAYAFRLREGGEDIEYYKSNRLIGSGTITTPIAIPQASNDLAFGASKDSVDSINNNLTGLAWTFILWKESIPDIELLQISGILKTEYET